MSEENLDAVAAQDDVKDCELKHECGCTAVEPDSSGLIDQAREKLISRKLLVFVTATCLLVWSNLDPNTWGMIAMCYIGSQTAIDFAKTWRGAQ